MILRFSLAHISVFDPALGNCAADEIHEYLRIDGTRCRQHVLLVVGQQAVLDLDAQNKRISLGLKQLEPDPWSVFVQKYNPGDVIQGKVRSLTDYGVFVGIEDGVDGMVHKSDLSWTQRINNPADLYRKGDEVEAIILSINHDDRKVSLGIKQLYEDPWSFVPERYPEGTVIEVRSTGADEYGVHVELERFEEYWAPRARPDRMIFLENISADVASVRFRNGDLDIVFGSDRQQNRLYLNDGTGVFTDVSEGRIPPALWGSTDVALGDVDADADVDDGEPRLAEAAVDHFSLT